MGPNTLVISYMASVMVMAGKSMLMAMCTTVNGTMTKQAGSGHILRVLIENTSDSGCWISNTEMDTKNGQMDLLLKDNTLGE